MAKIVDENALSAIASDIKTALSGKANSNDVYPKSQTYNRTEIDNALDLKADKSELYNVYPTDQESGSIVHITDGADNIPVKSLVSQIVAVESGSGEKSPDNSYTISGFDSGIIPRCGKNLIKKQALMQPVHLASGTTIYAKLFNFSGQFNLYGLKRGLPDVSTNWTALLLMSSNLGSVTLTDDYEYIGISSGAYTDLGLGDVQVSVEPFDTYSAYNGNTYIFPLGQTVFGGYFDNKGNLVVTYAQIDINSAINNRTTSYDNPVFYGSINGLKPQSNNSLCECFNTINGQVSVSAFANVSNNHDFAINSGNSGDTIQVFIRADEYTDVASLKSACGNSKIIYELANPITLSITSQDIPTLLGENNIFSNCGDVEVDYRADIGLYIDKKISSLAQG